ncbi:MAG: CC-adding tRNA nucleotidyltransferase [Chroococcopsis gigantea SAG 12.99]|jgi:tRNA nucleotidyltransferase (CCA-adding enzyme)|nr:CCA tRNA nucleotidyltransferase [Chlorogloea purpurea SAG 13.99]MDV2999860.1 CC-adding tRNA nucleotidyltransferase [Chroococcopsis gigantea SAG 12.99]
MDWHEPLIRLFSEDLPIKLAELPTDACLVGGAVRDALLGRRKDYLDLDFVVPQNALETAKAIANKYKAGFVILDRDRGIARVVFPQGTLDFAQQEGDTLETDLNRRDFRVNAIAYHPLTGTLIDPLNGLTDLENKTLRMVSEKNLRDDPLRLLRAYRQAAQLGFTIDETTRATIHQCAGLIIDVAAERVQSELNYLLLNPQGTNWLKSAWFDGVLSPWLTSVNSCRLSKVCQVEHNAKILEAGQFIFSNEQLHLTKLAILVGTDVVSAQKQLLDLKYSKLEIKTIITVVRNFHSLGQKQKLNQKLTMRDQYFLFLEVGKVFPVLALFALIGEIDRYTVLDLWKCYLDPHNNIAHPQPLLTGTDLIKKLNLSPGPLIGKLLTEVQIAHLEGKVDDVESAIDYAKGLI